MIVNEKKNMRTFIVFILMLTLICFVSLSCSKKVKVDDPRKYMTNIPGTNLYVVAIYDYDEYLKDMPGWSGPSEKLDSLNVKIEIGRVRMEPIDPNTFDFEKFDPNFMYRIPDSNVIVMSDTSTNP